MESKQIIMFFCELADFESFSLPSDQLKTTLLRLLIPTLRFLAQIKFYSIEQVLIVLRSTTRNCVVIFLTIRESPFCSSVDKVTLQESGEFSFNEKEAHNSLMV